MKRSLLFAVLIAIISSPVCFGGSILTTGLPIGAEKLAVQGYYDSNSVAGNSASQFGPKIIYGLTSDIDVMAKLGMGSFAGVSASSYGFGGKYTFLRVEEKDPMDVAGYINYETFSVTGYSFSTTSFGAIMSKYLRTNFTLYGILGVVSAGYSYKDAAGKTVSLSSSALQFGIGAKYDIRKGISFLGELTTFSADGNAYTTFSLGAQFMI